MKKDLELNNQQGFSLIELLVVVSIVGVLAAIAIPQFTSYKEKAYEARMESLYRSARTDLEAFFADGGNTVTSAQRGWYPGGSAPYAFTSFDLLLEATTVSEGDYVYVDSRACADLSQNSYFIQATNERAERALRIFKPCSSNAGFPFFYTKASNTRW